MRKEQIGARTAEGRGKKLKYDDGKLAPSAALMQRETLRQSKALRWEFEARVNEFGSWQVKRVRENEEFQEEWEKICG